MGGNQPWFPRYLGIDLKSKDDWHGGTQKSRFEWRKPSTRRHEQSTRNLIYIWRVCLLFFCFFTHSSYRNHTSTQEASILRYQPSSKNHKQETRNEKEQNGRRKRTIHILRKDHLRHHLLYMVPRHHLLRASWTLAPVRESQGSTTVLLQSCTGCRRNRVE